MKNNHRINKILALLSVYSLVGLLLIAPCKVRNAIESVLGITQTDVLNKPLTTTSTHSCSSFNCQITESSNSESVNSHQDTTPSEFGIFVYSESSSKEFSHFIESSENSFSSVPYYILYQNFRFYL